MGYPLYFISIFQKKINHEYFTFMYLNMNICQKNTVQQQAIGCSIDLFSPKKILFNKNITKKSILTLALICITPMVGYGLFRNQGPEGYKWLYGQGSSCVFPKRIQQTGKLCQALGMNYLRYKSSSALHVQASTVAFDRKNLIELVEEPKVDQETLDLSNVLMYHPYPLILKNPIPSTGGLLQTTQTADATTWSASSADPELYQDPYLQNPIDSGMPWSGPNSSVPLELLYFFQQPHMGQSSNSVILPFQVPLPSYPTPPPSVSEGAYILE